MDLPAEFNVSMAWLDALSGRSAIEALPATYGLLHQHPFGRLNGESRILYIGSTGKLGGSSESCRLRIYNYPNGPHAHSVRHRAQQLIDAGFAVTLHWVHQQCKTDAIALESKLLQEYLTIHAELPPFNSRC